jgi:hypothetical protein
LIDLQLALEGFAHGLQMIEQNLPLVSCRRDDLDGCPVGVRVEISQQLAQTLNN